MEFCEQATSDASGTLRVAILVAVTILALAGIVIWGRRTRGSTGPPLLLAALVLVTGLSPDQSDEESTADCIDSRAGLAPAESENEPEYFSFIDNFDQSEPELGDDWTDCSMNEPAEFDPIGVYDGAAVIADPFSRPTYDATDPGTPHPDDQLPGIGCAWVETNERKVTVSVIWSGNYGYTGLPPNAHVEGAPLMHIDGSHPRQAFGAWVSELFGDMVVLVGYLGGPPELFEPVAWGRIPQRPTGTPRLIELHSEAVGWATLWVDGAQIPLSDGIGLDAVPIDRSLTHSTKHGFGLDAHLTDPIESVPEVRGIEAFSVHAPRQRQPAL